MMSIWNRPWSNKSKWCRNYIKATCPVMITAFIFWIWLETFSLFQLSRTGWLSTRTEYAFLLRTTFRTWIECNKIYVTFCSPWRNRIRFWVQTLASSLYAFTFSFLNCTFSTHSFTLLFLHTYPSAVSRLRATNHYAPAGLVSSS